MTKVTSKKSISFPSLGWGITAGEERELPEGKEAQEAVLAHPEIEEVGGGASRSKSTTSSKKDEKDEKEDEKK
jgi:hypothetical protein